MSANASPGPAIVPPRQFSLRALFGAMTALGALLALTVQLPTLVIGVAALFWPAVLIVSGIWRGDKSQFQAGLVLQPAWLGLVALLMPACTCGGRAYSRNSQCQNNLKNISCALMNYETIHGVLPPAYFTDENGKPIHSWRVILLPYLEHKFLYDQYSFDEPWDGPNNRLLHNQVVHVYECPAVSFGSTETSYLAVVGQETIWPGAKRVSSATLSDGSSNTLHVVEVARSVIHWMEPRDLTFSGMPLKLNSVIPGGIRSHHRGHCNAVRCDGSICEMSNDIAPTEVRALLTASGNEDLQQFWKQKPPSR